MWKPYPRGSGLLERVRPAAHPERERSGLDDQHRDRRRAQGVRAEEPVDARRAVEQHPVVARFDLREHVEEHALGTDGALGALLEIRQPRVRGQQMDASRRSVDRVLDRGAAEQHGAERLLFRGRATEAERRVRLRIEIDEEHAISPRGEGSGEMHGHGGLAAAAFLVHERENVHAPARCVVRSNGRSVEQRARPASTRREALVESGRSPYAQGPARFVVECTCRARVVNGPPRCHLLDRAGCEALRSRERHRSAQLHAVRHRCIGGNPAHELGSVAEETLRGRPEALPAGAGDVLVRRAIHDDARRTCGFSALARL
jgi:hypothetical protein